MVTSFTLDQAAPTRAAEPSDETASSADERRVLAELGQPDRVEVFEHGGRREVTWWYFRVGRAYRFDAGRLRQVTPFEPVQPF